MVFQVSPGVATTEVDLTTVVPTVSTTTGGLAGVFRWGPVNQLTAISSEDVLANTFGTPTNFNAETFFTGANFLAYGNQLIVARAANTTDTTLNGNGTWTAFADSSGSIATEVANGTYQGANVDTAVFVLNNQDFINKQETGVFATQPTYLFAAKFPGAMGNSLEVSVVDSVNAYSSNLTNVVGVSFTPFSNTGTLSFSTGNTAQAAWANLVIGDWIQVGNNITGTQKLQLSNIGTLPGSANVTSVTVTTGNNYLTGISNTAGIGIGWNVVSSFVPANTTVLSVVNSSAVAVSGNSATFTAGTGSALFEQRFINLNLYSKYSASLAWNVPHAAGNIQRFWQFYNSVNGAPGTSEYQLQNGNNSIVDELHVVVSDTLGYFTGTPGQILEVYQGLSRATDATNADGSVNFYNTVLNQNSQYIWSINPRGSSYTSLASTLTNTTYNDPLSIDFAGGADGFTESNVGLNIGAITNAYDLFSSTENVSISLLLTGKSDDTNTTLLPNYLIQNIAETRLDCVVFVSPNRATVVNNLGYELPSVSNFRTGVISSTYGVLDTGYKYQYDKYNDIYRYIPLNGDIAGLCVYTDTVRDPWFSPAGFNRGQIKNIVKLAYNPSKSDRDILYPLGINPVVTFPGQGTILFGDKTLSAKPSAFDRINVRRLFIVLEKAISLAAQYSLFEINNSFTQAQFVSMVTPFLKTVQGRQGIYDFKVVCDSTNNTAAVIDANQFVGDIYIKPAKSSNYIQLNFIAVRTGVQFSQIVGQGF